MRFKLLLFTLLCTLAAITPARADELTVYNGTDQSYYAPAYIYYWDDFARSECVIPAADLADMAGGTITALKFYTNKNSLTTKAAGNFYLKEVNYTSISAYETKENCTIIYTGTLTTDANGETTITLTTPFQYNGGNLLIGSENTTDAGWDAVQFYGKTVSGACIAGSNGSSVASAPATQRDFIPKTTFTYEPPTAYAKPTNLAVSDITSTTAKATWDGNENAISYNLRYRPFTATLWDFDDSSMGDWTTIDADGDGYNWVLGSACGGIYLAEGGSLAGTGHNYSQDMVVSGSFSNVVGVLNPDNYLVSPEVTLGGKLTFWAKGQDSSYPSEVFGVAVSTASNTNTADFTMIGANKTATTDWVEYTFDLSQYAGQEGYIAIRHYNCSDQFMLDIDDIQYSLPGEWIVKNGVTSPYVMGEDNDPALTLSTEYEVQVQAVYADDTSDWTNSVYFTTSDGLDVPTNLAVSDITDCTANATWNGIQNNYNLRYRTPYTADVLFFESFENGLDAWTLVDSDGDGNNWLLVDPENTFNNSTLPRFDGTYCVMSRSYNGNALTPDQWLISPQIEDLGGMLRYYVLDDGANYPETYRIYVSTTDTDINSFVAVTEDMQTPNLAAWTEQSVDLSAYTGQSGHIAFRHYNCSDKDFMFIDAIGIYKNEVPAGEWVTIENVTSPYTMGTGENENPLDPETTYEVQVQGIFNGSTTDWTGSTLFTTLMKSTSLADIETANVNGRYLVEDQLVAVEYRTVGENDVYLWCKDQGDASINATSATGDQIDFLLNDEEAQNGRPWDQSNWVILKLTGSAGLALADQAKGHYIKEKTIIGTYDAAEGLIVVDGAFTVEDGDASYTKNVYCTSNFIEANLGQPGAQTGQNDQYYFFMNPKNQEVCHITYAMWDGTKFTVPSNSGFTGELTIDMAYNTNAEGTPIPEPTLVEGTSYHFDAIVSKSMSKAGGYVVYPANLTGGDENIATAINTVSVNGEVVGVEYVNSLGMTSKTPFQGVNIVVTHYSDGATTTVKRVFK